MDTLVKTCRSFKTQCAVGLIVAALSLSSVAMADETADINRLVKSGQTAEALNKVDQVLAGKPRDPQMRFLKGVLLTESGKSNDAVSVFVKLTEDFPELPEPYNNLAVLYAGQNQFDKARTALEMAIRTNPSYATAHENLGDVYAKLASQSYSKALQLDGSNAGVPPKLALIRNLFAPSDAKGGARPVAMPAAPVAKPAVATAEPKAESKNAGTDNADITAAIEAWAKAWSNKDMSGYLGAYASSFAPPSRQSRSAWEAERKDRITSKNSISVSASDFNIKVNDDKAIATFRQAYKAGALTSNGRKTLEMTRQGGRWLIVKEISN
jgi:tetratricopeptide (TPR) repeat protein